VKNRVTPLRKPDDHHEIKSILSRARPRSLPTPSVEWSRSTRDARFGNGMMIVAVFVLALSFAMPTEFSRWMFLIFALIVLAVGAYYHDRANRAQRRAERESSSSEQSVGRSRRTP
jgi:multisubunit Na+/H+ antiporter MnhG subunit